LIFKSARALWPRWYYFLFMTTAAILVAAGSSARMGFDKLTAPLCGRTVLEWSLRAFQDCPAIDRAVLVCAPQRLAEFTELAAAFPKFRDIVSGGAERSVSVLHGFQALASDPPDFVAVHDAARPLVTPALIQKVVTAAESHRAASAAQPVTDSLHRVDALGGLAETIPRAHLFAMETPQAARHDLLLAALEAHHLGATDEVSALIANGIHPVPVLHEALNFKITFPRDLVLAEFFLQES
jgi:2-C-methyl-D-erythritol 4-phosphate cytidylyltransferase